MEGTGSLQDSCSPTRISPLGKSHRLGYVFIHEKPVSVNQRTQTQRGGPVLFAVNSCDRRERLPFQSSPGSSGPFAMTVLCSGWGLFFTGDTDVSALVRDFIKAPPVVYRDERLPRLIFLQYIPVCSLLAPKNSQVGISCWCHISEL